MIPNFKTYLKESIWMNIHKRSNNELDRKEEDINLLNVDGLENYLNELYDANIKKKNEPGCERGGVSITLVKSLKIRANAPVFKGWPLGLLYSFEDNTISFTNKKADDLCPHLYDEVKKFFTIQDDVMGYPDIYPSDGSEVNIKFFIQVIDTIIDHLDPNEEEIMITRR